jgi:hypothetical protein
MAKVFLLLSALSTITNALDIEFDKIICDQSLPAYVLEDNVQMTCNNGVDSRCTFGNSVVISGSSKFLEMEKICIHFVLHAMPS